VAKVSRKESIIGGNLKMFHVHVLSAATTVSRRRLSAVIVVRCFEGFTGTTAYGEPLVGWLIEKVTVYVVLFSSIGW
jgi:hypothetical protein